MTISEVRKFLDTLFPTAADFDAFCLDHFVDVKRRFSDHMDRVSRVNLLLECIPCDEILQTIKHNYEDKLKKVLLSHTSEERLSSPILNLQSVHTLTDLNKEGGENRDPRKLQTLVGGSDKQARIISRNVGYFLLTIMCILFIILVTWIAKRNIGTNWQDQSRPRGSVKLISPANHDRHSSHPNLVLLEFQRDSHIRQVEFSSTEITHQNYGLTMSYRADVQ